MAFSYAITQSVPLAAGARMIIGTWTGSLGDAAGTIAIAGAPMGPSVFQKLDSKDNTYEIIARVGASTTSGITTYTIENQDVVTNGYFSVIHGGS